MHVGYADAGGGAARAAYRIHQSLVEAGVDSRMRVLHKSSDDERVCGGRAAGMGAIERRVRAWLGSLPLRGFQTENPIIHSPAWPATGLGQELNASASDVLHLHWLGQGTLSVEEIGRLTKPIVWTLHDMWAFCGAEHYADESAASRFRSSYRRENAPAAERRNDLNRRVWLRKRRAWTKAIHIVCPSRWMAECARASALMGTWPVSVIPHPIDTGFWRPLPKAVAREAMGLNPEARIALMGAIGGLKDPRKGADLALAALGRVAATNQGPDELLVFGKGEGSAASHDLPIPIRFLGHLHDDISLKIAYSAADLMIVPSLQEAFGQTASEAHACGTAVVAFEVGGLADIVAHRQTGWLARPADVDHLAQGIAWVLEDEKRRQDLHERARRHALERFAPEKIAAQYVDVYASAALQAPPIR